MSEQTNKKESICGADCSVCPGRDECPGCVATDGCPSGKKCNIAAYIQSNGMDKYLELKRNLAAKFNALGIPGMAEIKDLNPLVGFYVNLEYPLPSGEKVKFLKDDMMYLGNQTPCEGKEGRCYGVIGNREFILVCAYDEDGKNPELVLFRKE